MAATLLALDLPNPFEDLDPNFIYRRWTMEVNTTRRTDHSARFQVTAGAFVAAKLHAAQTQNPKLLSTVWASSVGPQGYRAAAPRVLLAQPSFPALFTYPDNALASMHCGLGSPNLAETLTPGLGGGSPFARLPVVAPSSAQPLTAHAVLQSLALGQNNLKSGLFSSPSAQPLGLVYPTSPWFFRPSTFSQTALFSPTKYAPTSGANLALLSLVSLYTGVVCEGLDGLDSSLLKTGSWAPSPTHPLLSLLPASSAPTFSNTFLSRLAEQWVLGGALQKDLYVSMPSDIRSIRRLRASKAVCLPCDVPMHIVCGSKDVIHSWAIPGLCIKIDCIPGFSSHRRLTLR